MPPATGSEISTSLVDPGSTVGDIGTVFSPRTDVVSCVRSLTLAVSPQLTTLAAPLTRSNGMTLLGNTGAPAFGPVVGTLPALNPDAVGEARTTFASMSLLGLCGGRGSGTVRPWNRKSEAAFSTGTAITGVICGTTIAAVEIGGRKRCE